MAYKDANGEIRCSFSGYLRMKFLDPEQPAPADMGVTRTGDWADERKKYQITKKPRKFSVNIHLFNDKGQKALSTAFMLDAGGMKELKQAITKATVDMMKENKDQVIDLYGSYAIIRV